VLRKYLTPSIKREWRNRYCVWQKLMWLSLHSEQHRHRCLSDCSWQFHLLSTWTDRDYLHPKQLPSLKYWAGKVLPKGIHTTWAFTFPSIVSMDIEVSVNVCSVQTKEASSLQSLTLQSKQPYYKHSIPTSQFNAFHFPKEKRKGLLISNDNKLVVWKREWCLPYFWT
jgi:hypothetical protein